MLHAMFHENQHAASGEFEGFLPYMGMVAKMPQTNFRSPYPRGLHIKFGFDWPSGFGGEDL